MIARCVRRDEVELRELVGRVICHDLRVNGGRPAIRKGTVLRPADLDLLASVPWEELHLIELEAGELHEQEAGRRLAQTVAGEGVEVRSPTAGAWPLVATRRGLLEVDVSVLHRVNSIDPLAVYTLYTGQVVDAEELVARAKIIPLAVAAERLREAKAAVGDGGGVLRVRPFLPLRVGALVLGGLAEDALARFRMNLGEKLAWFNSELIPPLTAAPTTPAIHAALERLRTEGAQVLVVAGVKAMDPLDPAFEALRRLDVRLERIGVPAHPGSLFWLARWGGVSVLGMPGCGLFSQATTFDLVLPRVLAGERLCSASLAELGHGGLLTRDMSFRFPPYRPARGRGEVQ